MSRGTALVIAIVALATVGCVSAVLVVEFHGNDTTILLAAIFGFLTPTIIGLLTLLQASVNAEKQQEISAKVDDVNEKVDGHLTRLTRIVVDSAAANTPISVQDAAALAAHTTNLTGTAIAPPGAPTGGSEGKPA